MKPCKIEDDGTPVFTTLQIENFGLPDYYGYHVYLVIEQRDSQIFCTDFQMEQELEIKKIHRYDRYERFKNILDQIKIFSWKFDQQKESLNRKYFPNMRYVALKLIQLNNVQLNYQAPFTRTKRIGQELDIIWNILN